MIAAEARWVRRALAGLPDGRLFPLLNVGSQDEEFRKRRQPWIDAEVFAPLRKRGASVKHLDMMAGDGVDIVADLLDESVAQHLHGFRSVLCANVLEHVHDRGRFARALEEIVMPGGYLIVTCPRRFPYHPDPIDTLYRPDVAELSALFPSMRIHSSAVVGSRMFEYLLLSAWALLRHGPGRSLAIKPKPIARPPFLRWLFKRIQATCLVLQKPA